MKVRISVLVLAVVAIGTAATALLYPRPERPPRHAFIDRDSQGLFLQIDLSDAPFDYACLTSAEYNQLYLADAWRCAECSTSEATRDLISDVRAPFLPLLMIKRGDEIFVEYVQLPRDWINDGDVIIMRKSRRIIGHTNLGYKNIALNHNNYLHENLDQCTLIPEHKLRCTYGLSFHLIKRCNFYFPRRPRVEHPAKG